MCHGPKLEPRRHDGDDESDDDDAVRGGRQRFGARTLGARQGSKWTSPAASSKSIGTSKSFNDTSGFGFLENDECRQRDFFFASNSLRVKDGKAVAINLKSGKKSIFIKLKGSDFVRYDRAQCGRHQVENSTA